LDFLKDAFEAIEQRIRSPFFGSIAIAFVAINWKSIWYMLFADQSAVVKFSFFDQTTDEVSLLWLPLAVGGLFALASPALSLFGAWWAKWPTFQLKKIQRDQAYDLKIHDADKQTKLQDKLKAAENAQADRLAEQGRRLIEAAKRKQDAEKLGSDTVSEIETARKENVSVSEAFEILGDNELAGSLLLAAAGGADGQLGLDDLRVSNTKPSIGRSTVFTLNNHRQRLEADSLLLKLCEFGLMNNLVGTHYEITFKGYEYIDKYKAG
jgi:hypothetical protein